MENMEKNNSNYECWIYQGTTFWTANSIDKPSFNLFKTRYEKAMEKINFTPNFIDQFTVELVTDRNYYGVLKIVDKIENKTLYYINSNTTKKLTNGYVVTFDLDLYLSFGEALFTGIQELPFSMIKVNRLLMPVLFRKANLPTYLQTKYYNDNVFWPLEKYKYTPDPVLNYEKYSMTSFTRPYNLNWRSISRCDYITDSGFANLQFMTDTNNAFNGNCKFKFSHGAKLFKPFVHVYQLKTGSYYLFLQPFNSGWGSLDMPNWVSASDRQIFRNKGVLNNDDSFKLKALDNFNNRLTAAIPWLANKYVGCFEIPFIEGYINWLVWDGKFSSSGNHTNDIDTFGKSNEILLMAGIDRDSYTWLYKMSYNQANFGYVGMINKITKNSGSFKLQPNTTDANNFLIHFANPYKFTYLPFIDEDKPPLDFWSNSGFSFDGNNFTIIQNSATPHGTTTSIPNLFKNMLNGGNNINQLRGTLNVAADSYNEYVNSVKANQNTNLQIAKQEQVSSGIQNIIGGMIGASAGVLSGNWGGVAATFSNTMFGAYNNQMKYQNYQKQIDAQNQTARNTATANNLSSSVTADDIYNKMNIVAENELTTGYINIALKYPQTNAEQLEVLNYVVNYGIYINDYLPGDLIFAWAKYGDDLFINNHIYLDFEIDERTLKQILPKENQTMIDALKILCQNSFRIWKVVNNNYNTSTTYYVF